MGLTKNNSPESLGKTRSNGRHCCQPCWALLSHRCMSEWGDGGDMKRLLDSHTRHVLTRADFQLTGVDKSQPTGTWLADIGQSWQTTYWFSLGMNWMPSASQTNVSFFDDWCCWTVCLTFVDMAVDVLATDVIFNRKLLPSISVHSNTFRQLMFTMVSRFNRVRYGYARDILSADATGPSGSIFVSDILHVVWDHPWSGAISQ